MATGTHSQALGVITFQTGFFAEILNIGISSFGKREMLDCTNMSVAAPSASVVGNKIWIPSFYCDGGELEVEIQYNPDTVPPTSAATASCTVKLGNSATQATLVGNAALHDMNIKAPLDGQVMRATCKVKFTGGVTITAGT